MPGPRVTPQEIARIRELRAQKLSEAVVATMVGRGRATVQRYAPGHLARPRFELLTSEQIAEICRLRTDGHTATAVAEMFDISPQTVRKYAPGRVGKVPVAPLREAFLASSTTAADVARSLEWWCKDCFADGSRVRRTLGLLPDISGTGRRSYRNLVDAETVMLIAEAIGISPWAVLPDDDEQVAA